MRVLVIHTNLRGVVAQTVGFVIVTGRPFYYLSTREQEAVLAHEMGHISCFHAFKRWWWIVTLQWFDLQERCWEQEYEADAYAAEEGHAVGLISLLRRSKKTESPLHPPPDARIENIRTVLRSLSDGKRLSI